MDDRTRTFYSFLLPAVTALALTGCSATQQSRFQMAFLPPSPPSPAPSGEIGPPPDVPANLYLKDVPAFLLDAPQISPRRSRADAMIQQAEHRFQRGRRYYQVQDLTGARKEFDSAIDLILEASDQNPTDRQDYEKKLDEMVDAIYRFDLAGMGAAAPSEEAQFEKAPLEDILQMTFPVDPKLKNRVQEQLASTVSQLPLTVNDTVLGYINYFANRGHKTLLAGYRRSGRYRPMIQRVLDEEGVPQELIHLAQAESGFIPRAVSRAAAGGMWQFLSWRGAQYGLLRTPYSDDRMDPEKATRAAARHLHDLYKEFGDWYLAIAAYNCGPVTVEKAVERTGYADFWELRERGVLPKETTNYVPIIMAMTIMEKNAAEYGLEGFELDPPLEYDTVETPAATSLALVSDITEAPTAELTEINPGLLKGIAPAGYALHVPKGTAGQFMAAVQLVPSERRADWRMHRVSSGENLDDIAKRYRASRDGILAANKLAGGTLMEGDRLIIPAVRPAERPARTTTASSRQPRRKTTSARGQVQTASSRTSGTAVRTASARPHAGTTTRAAGTSQSRIRTASRTTTKSGATVRRTSTTTARPPRSRVMVANTETR